LAGPIAGIVLGTAVVVFLSFGPPMETKLGQAVSFYALWTTFGWSAVNLLPLMPLDGGNVVRALLSWKDPEKGTIRALWLSIIVGPLLALAIYLAQPAYQMMSVFLMLFVFSSGRQLFEMRKLVRDRDTGLFASFEQAQAALKSHQYADAETLARKVLAQARTSRLRVAAAHVGASACLENQKPEAALSILSEISPHDVDSTLYGACLMASGKISDSVPYLEEALRAQPSSVLARQLLVSALEASGMRERAQQIRAGEGSPEG
jgi:hypothetical protein